jgi:hypothetical protein
MEEELNFDNILEPDEIDNLFIEEETKEDDTSSKENNKDKETKETKETEDTTEIDVEDLLQSESVGGEDDNTEEKEGATSKGNSTSPEKNFYSSIATALKDEGIFPDLDDEIITKVKEPSDFRDLVEQQIKAGLDERQKRIDEALNYGVEPSQVSQYERTLDYLDSLNDESITDESEKGEILRKNLIYQDLINRGYSKERAEKATQRSIDNGNDIDDAKDALQGNKEYFKTKYDALIKEAKANEEQEIKDRKERAEKLKKSILEDKNIFGDLAVDKATRQKIFDNISKPIYKDPDSGELFTAIQKYERENSTEFLKNVGLLYTLTDGFKNIDSLIKGKVKKEVGKGLKELEKVLNSTSRDSSGNLNFRRGTSDMPTIGKDWDLDI